MVFNTAFLVVLTMHWSIVQISNHYTGLQCLCSACKLVKVLKEVFLSNILSRNTILERTFAFERITSLQVLPKDTPHTCPIYNFLSRNHAIVSFKISKNNLFAITDSPSSEQTFTEKPYWYIAEQELKISRIFSLF